MTFWLAYKNKIMLSVFAVLLILAALEMVLRIKHDHPQRILEYPQGSMAMLSDTLWYNRPDCSHYLESREFSNIIQHDAEGHRVEPGETAGKPAGRSQPKKILALGDSFTYGWGAADGKSYIAQLAGRLNEQGPISCAMVNAGCRSYGIEEEKQYLERSIARIKPDIVLLNILSNDLRDLGDGPGRLRVVNGYLLTQGGAKIVLSRSWLIRNIYVFPWLYLRLERARYLFSVGPAFMKNSRLRAELEEKAVSLIREMQAICEQHGARLIVVYIPERDGHLMVSSFSKYLDEHCPGLLIDTLPEFLQQGNLPSLYYKKDKHFNEKGYRFLAEIVYKRLRQIIETKEL